MGDEAPNSQASSHFVLDPVPGSILLEQEVARRDGLRQRGNLMTGCQELDESVLSGGFERGCVVGLSAEDEEIGLLIGLQTISRFMASVGLRDSSTGPRVVIITTLSAGVLLPTLRGAITAQLGSRQEGTPDLNGRIRAILERVSISRIFDFEGLWEVLGELDPTPSPVSTPEVGQEAATHEQLESHPPSGADSSSPKDKSKTVIQDSEDEDDLSTPRSATRSPKAPIPPTLPPQSSNIPAKPAGRPSTPDIILITHMSSLLTALFTRREKSTAHATIQLLSSHLRFLARSPNHGAPLIMVLNSTSSSATDHSNHKRPIAESDITADRPRAHRPPSTATKPLDPTLRSIFNPTPLRPGYGYGHGYGGDVSPQYHGNSSGNNKPSFGLVFAQLLDVHLLCSRVPRTRADAEVVFAPRHTTPPPVAVAPRFAWVVEVLLDEIGVWDGVGSGRPRRSREQRWGAVDVVDGVRLVDAFGGGKER